MSCNSSACGIITFEDDNSRMSLASNCSSVNESNNAENQVNVSCETIERADLEEECNKRSYLDGTWFAPDFSRSTTGKVYGMCQICKSDHNKNCIISGPLHSSSNFNTHLKRVHSQRLAEFDNYCLSKKRSGQSYQNKKKRTACCDFSQKEFEQNVINYILDSFAPYNTVQQPSFRKIFNDMNIHKDGKQLHHLSTRTLVRKIEESYKSKMTNIKDEISKVNCVCTTADIWTSHSRRFMGVTVHWIDEKSLKRMSYAIACRRFSGSHTHDRIANILNEIHLKYEITREKLIATVTDNGSNFVKAFKRFGIHLDGDSQFYEDYIETYDEQDNQYEHESTEIMSFQEIVSQLLPTHQRCASHTLHLVATSDILRGIQSSENIKLMYNDIMQKCSTLWKSARSPKKYEIIVETLKEALKRPVVTR